ncbi:hypothetical protein [Nocardiopsis sp. MG754419]|uniref:hypothetical protein n=1 Tax=Nocardiopsis sp. MG754419 TaxID=2259865 RepID=UPI001BA7E801|nr:hypothetical protein [Nocardiopsis sp. MG754419]
MTDARLILLGGFTLAVTAIASHFGRKSEDAKGKQLDTKNKSIQSPEVQAQATFAILDREYAAIAAHKQMEEKNFEMRLSSTLQDVKSFSSFAKHGPSQGLDDSVYAIQRIINTSSEKKRQSDTEKRKQASKNKAVAARLRNQNSGPKKQPRKK